MIRLMSVAASAAVIAAIAVLDSPVLRGQSAASVEHGKSFSIHASGAALPAEMDRINLMLRDGSLDIEASQTDTMIEGRIHERLKQVYEGVPVFGGQVVRHQSTVGRGTGVFGDTKKVSAFQVPGFFRTDDRLRPAANLTFDFRGSFARLLSFNGVFFNSDFGTDSDNVWTDVGVN